MDISVDPAPVDPIITDPIPKQLKLLLIEMVGQISLVATRIDMLKNLETL